MLIVANYDWLVRMPPKGRLITILREAILARKLNARIVAAPSDLWSLRLNLHASVLIAAAGGWTLICQNSVEQAQQFLLPNPVPALWIWPKVEVRKWITEEESAKPGRLALLAASGDPVRKRYFLQLRNQLEDSGFETVDTQKNLPWDDYFSLVRSAKLVATTCWIQPIFHVGPERFRRLIADGHITMRVWEGFAVGATVLVPEVSALREIGFEANKHYLNLPPAGEWDTWVLPPAESLTAIGLAGHRRFLELAGL